MYLPAQRVKLADGAQLDAFGRLRTSHPKALFASKLLYDARPLVWDDQTVSGGGVSSTFIATQSQVRLQADASIAGKRVRQTFRRMHYQPGKSQLLRMTGIIAETGGSLSSITRRLGAFDDNNGFLFQHAAGVLSVGVRTFTSGSAVTTTVAQSAWNIDRMDGSHGSLNPSGIALDPTKIQIWVIDFQWLSAGRIRFAVDIAGVLYYVHEHLVANLSVLPSIQIPNLPLRYSIESVGGAVGTSTMTCVCAEVSSEGGSEDIGYPGSANTGQTQIASSGGTDTTKHMLLAIRMQAGKTAGTILPSSFSVMATNATAQYLIEVALNPTLSAGPTYAPVAGSIVEAAPGNGTITTTGGTLLFSEYAQSNHTSTPIILPSQEIALGSNIAGTSDVLAISVANVPANTGAQHFSGSINWRELL